MTLRPEYSLGHSEYNAFLFAAVGEEAVGLPLTVLTALSRLGIDPWVYGKHLTYYQYERTKFPHQGVGKWISF